MPRIRKNPAERARVRPILKGCDRANAASFGRIPLVFDLEVA